MKYIILILLVLVTPLQAQNVSGGFHYQTSPDFDGYSIGHFFKGMGTCALLTTFAKPGPAMVFVIFGAFAFEIVCDGFQNDFLWHKADPDGADLLGDPLFDIAGGMFWIIFKSSMKRLNDKVSIGIQGNEIKLCINF